MQSQWIYRLVDRLAETFSVCLSLWEEAQRYTKSREFSFNSHSFLHLNRKLDAENSQNEIKRLLPWLRALTENLRVGNLHDAAAEHVAYFIKN